jgi:ubiquinol-cytochrome c reductase iron-sulfur subunit
VTDQTSLEHGGAVDEDRRNFIHIATGAAAFGGAAMFAWVAVDQWNPAADTKAASALDVDISKIPLGSEIRVLIGGKPFFVRHRTPAEISAAESVNVASLRDPQTDDERLNPMPNGELNRAILITSGSCTHLGCVPVGRLRVTPATSAAGTALATARTTIRLAASVRARLLSIFRFRTTAMFRTPWSTSRCKDGSP